MNHRELEWNRCLEEPNFLAVWADYQCTGLVMNLDTYVGSIGSPLPDELWQELAAWVEAYNPIITMDKAAIVKEQDRWDALDQQGIELAKRVSSLLHGSIPVYYQSEYRKRFLWPPGEVPESYRYKGTQGYKDTDWNPWFEKAEYLVVWADYESTGMNMNYGARLGSIGSPLPEELWQELATWVEAYSPVILLRDAARDEEKEKWEALDEQGIEMAKRVHSLLHGSTTVYYYSEYKQQYLWRGAKDPQPEPTPEWLLPDPLDD
jgi:hypothetical protein